MYSKRLEVSKTTSLAILLVEMAVMADLLESLGYACYKLEGDGPLAIMAHEILNTAFNYVLYVISCATMLCFCPVISLPAFWLSMPLSECLRVTAICAYCSGGTRAMANTHKMIDIITLGDVQVRPHWQSMVDACLRPAQEYVRAERQSGKLAEPEELYNALRVFNPATLRGYALGSA
jgi:hypothetical protein